MARAQGSLEYMVIIAVILAVSSIVIVYMTGIVGGQKTTFSLTSCKQASIDCKASKMLSALDPCTSCGTACKDSTGAELFDGATYCCSHAQTDLIYEDSSGCGGGYSTTICSDGTVKLTCSSTKPKFCDAGLNLIDDCATCGCPTGYACNPTTKACYLACSDGTPLSTCSATPNTYCTSGGALVADCVQCPSCPSGQTCNPSTKTCYSSCSDGTPLSTCSATPNTYCTSGGALVADCVQCPSCPSGQTCNPTTKACYLSCSDGTAYGACAATKPVYCSAGTLINNCPVCGCPTSMACNVTDNSCYTPLVMKELFYDEFSSMSAWTGSIASDAWRLNTTSGYINSNSAVDYNYSTLNITHTQNTAGATKINVSFWAKNAQQDAGEVMRFEWFDGTSWTNMGSLPNNGVWTYYSYNLPSSAENKANFAIRFLCYDWHTGPLPDACWVDTVKIRALFAGCSDGTLLGQCSVTKPKYCELGALVDRCSSCGCPPPGTPYSCCCDDTSRGTCTNSYYCDGTSCQVDVQTSSCSVCPSGCCFGHVCSSFC